MASIPLYLFENDIRFLNDWINQEDELAFLVSNGEKRWIARKEHNILSDLGRKQIYRGTEVIVNFLPKCAIWHIPSGPLPMIEAHKGFVSIYFSKEDRPDDILIEDPWSGWTEQRTGMDPFTPYFGAGHPGVINLDINLPRHDEIRISHFGWIGNHYKLIGNGATDSTMKFWNKIRRFVKKTATHIPRDNAPGGTKEIYAFPSAYEEIKNGRSCSSM